MSIASAHSPANCYCGSDTPYQQCCEPFHRYQSHAQSAEQLMRSRFSACVLKDIDYLLNTTHHSTRSLYCRDDLLDWLGQQQWLSLKVVQHDVISSAQASVEFAAFYWPIQQAKPLCQHREYSRFLRELDDGVLKWFFVDGQDRPDLQIQRNQSCPCGSGKKHKKCCL